MTVLKKKLMKLLQDMQNTQIFGCDAEGRRGNPKRKRFKRDESVCAHCARQIKNEKTKSQI